MIRFRFPEDGNDGIDTTTRPGPVHVQTLLKVVPLGKAVRLAEVARREQGNQNGGTAQGVEGHIGGERITARADHFGEPADTGPHRRAQITEECRDPLFVDLADMTQVEVAHGDSRRMARSQGVGDLGVCQAVVEELPPAPWPLVTPNGLFLEMQAI